MLDEVPTTPDSAGWITVQLTRLIFPPYCCDCGERTSRTMNFQVESRWDAIAGILVPAGDGLMVPIPVCEACQQRIRDRQRRGGMNGMRIRALVFGGMGALLVWNEGWREASPLLVIGLAFLAVGGIAGFIVGSLMSRQLPAQLGRYSPRRGTLALRFRHSEYAVRLLIALRRQTTPNGGR